jgi:hypothetical protein
MFWNLFTDYKTALPAILVIGFPLIGQGHVHMDWHVEAAGIFWTVAYALSAVAGSTVYEAISSSPLARMAEVRASEAKYENALESALQVHKRAMVLPAVVDQLNVALADLHKAEAVAATQSVKISHRNKMVSMLDYLVSSQQQTGDATDTVITSTVSAVEAKLNTDKALAQKILDEAVDSFVSGSSNFGTLRAEFVKQLAAFEANPPQEAGSDAMSEEDKLRELFTKRFGFTETTVTQATLEKAQRSKAAMAYLTARCGGVTPAVGVKITERMPIDY